MPEFTIHRPGCKVWANGVECVVLNARIYESEILYEAAWWSDKVRYTAILASFEIQAGSNTSTRRVGFLPG